MATVFIQFAAFNGLLAVVLGAFGAHALKARLTTEMLSTYETAVQYHFYHSLALLAVGILAYQLPNSRLLTGSGIAFSIGIVLFSGSLYLLATTTLRYIGAFPVGIITPLGGLCFIAGWALLLATSFTLK